MLIQTAEEHDKALAEAMVLMDALPDLPLDQLNPAQLHQAARLDELADAIEAYEKIHYPIDGTDLQ